MFSFRRRGIRRANRKAKRTVRGAAARVAFRVVKPLAPGIIAAAAKGYFMDPATGSDRRKKVIGRVGGVFRGRQ